MTTSRPTATWPTSGRTGLPIRSAVAEIVPPSPRYYALRTRHKLSISQGHRPRVEDRGLDCVAIARQLEFE